LDGGNSVIPTPEIGIYRPTAEDLPIVENLIEFYVYEFSSSAHLDVGTNGRFGYDDLADYWKLDGLYPYLMTSEGKWCGLALVQRGSVVSANADVWDMEEFFVMRRYRRGGYGTEFVRRLWRRHPGRWEIRVLETNESALQFWLVAVRAECGVKVVPSRAVVNGKNYCVLSFQVEAGT
jgi:predicted acetyltransferase